MGLVCQQPSCSHTQQRSATTGTSRLSKAVRYLGYCFLISFQAPGLPLWSGQEKLCLMLAGSLAGVGVLLTSMRCHPRFGIRVLCWEEPVSSG